jgi:hypothetical protein
MKRTEEERKQAAEEIVKSKSGNNIEKVTDRYMKTIESMGLQELKFMKENEDYRHDCALTQPVLIAFNAKCMKIEDGAKQIAEENKKLYTEYEEVWDNYIKNTNERFAMLADTAKDLVVQIEEL